MSCKFVCEKLVGAWEAVQVELHGQYSLGRLKSLHAYVATASAWRVCAVILATPIPCLVAVAIADAIPMAPPERGIDHSFGLWVRSFFSTFVYSHTITSQTFNYVPRLETTQREVAATSALVALSTCAATYGLARVIGFPLPFTIPMTATPWVVSMMLAMWIRRGRFLRQNPDVLKNLLRYALVTACQVSMIVIYPAFYTAFSHLSSSAQTLFTLLLPTIKLVEKNVLSSVLADRDDIKPEVVVFNVEIFNALFVSLCMQSSTSVHTNIVIMVVDFVQACLGVRDLNKMLVDFNRLADKMNMEKDQLVETTVTILHDYPTTARHRSLSSAMFRPNPTPRQPRSSQIAPLVDNFVDQNKTNSTRTPMPTTPELSYPPPYPPAASKNTSQSSSGVAATKDSSKKQTVQDALAPRKKVSIAAVLSDDERLAFVQRALQVLFLIEFLLLIEFTEVMVPAVYCAWLNDSASMKRDDSSSTRILTNAPS